MAVGGSHMDGKHLCEGCRERKARFQYRGVVKADRGHTLCFACFRSERDRLRARELAEESAGGYANAAAPGEQFPLGRPVTMTPAQRAHRFRMLTHLRRTGSSR